MQYIDELRDNADAHFKEWLRALADPTDETARAAAWGLRLRLDGLSPEDALIRVAEGMERYAANYRILYAASVAGGPHDDDDSIESVMEVVQAILSDRALTEPEREKARCVRIVKRIKRGDFSELDVRWLEERAALMSDAQVLSMEPFEGERVVEVERRVVRVTTPQTDHWTRREIPPGERHLLLRESLQGRVRETRHSLLSAFLHVVCGDGGATEFLAEYDEHVALAS
jgi:hypothetical protein